MKLIRFGNQGYEKPGLFVQNIRYDVSHFVKDYDEDFFSDNGLQKLKNVDVTNLPIVNDNERWAAAICRPSKLICVGLNYKDHADETGADYPKEPVLFFKSSTSIVGPYDNVVIPKNSLKTDWEVELAVVISKKTSYIEEKDAENYIAGYVLHNDYSEREFQLEKNGQWCKGKGCDTFGPIGPFMATSDEIKDVHQLRLWLKVNEQLMQNGNTNNLIFNVHFIVSYISQFMTLLPGDIISTGTPAGVGLGQKPNPWYLKSGDIVTLGIDGLGSSRQIVKKYSA